VRNRRLGYLTSYWLKLIAYLAYPLSFGAPAPCVPFGISRWS